MPAMLAIMLVFGCAHGARAQLYAPRSHPPAPKAWQEQAPEPKTVRTSDGLVLKGLYWRGRAELPLLLFFQGRSGDQMDAAHYAEPFALAGYPLLIASYRGYGGNPGSPDEAGLTRDGLAFITLARGLHPEGKVYLVGHSLGAAVAMNVAAEVPADGIIALGAFPDLRSVAPKLLRGFLADRYSNLDTARRLTTPIVLIYGRNDDVVSFAQARQLLEATPLDSLLLVLDKQDHRPDLALIAAILPAIFAAGKGEFNPLIAEAKARTFAIFRKEPASSSLPSPPKPADPR